MRLKPGVRLHKLQPQIVLALVIAQEVFKETHHELVVTSCTDGTHMDTSKHYSGCAVDLRTKHIDDGFTGPTLGKPATEVKYDILHKLRHHLGTDFDILLEGLGKAHEHIHLEWDPK